MAYRIIDLSKIPEEYINDKGRPNIAKLTKAIKSGIKVPGVEVYASN